MKMGVKRKFAAYITAVFMAAAFLSSSFLSLDANAETFRIEAENAYKTGALGEYYVSQKSDAGSDGGYFLNVTGAKDTQSFDECYAELEFYVPEDGYYALSWKSSVMKPKERSMTWLSSAQVYINGVMAENYIEKSTAGNYGVYKMFSVLPEGANRIRFNVTDLGWNNSLSFMIDYMETEKISGNENAEIVVEAEEWLSASHTPSVYESSVSSGGKKIQLAPAYPAEIELEYEVFSPQKGNYMLTVQGSNKETWFSNYSIEINGEKITEASEWSFRKNIDSQSPYIHLLATNKTVTLNGGINKLKVFSNEKRIGSNHVVIALDCFRFSPVESGNLTVEAESMCPGGFKVTETAGMTLLAVEPNKGNVGKEVSYSVNIPESGSYELYMNIVAYITQSLPEMERWVAKALISIDGGEYEILSDYEENPNAEWCETIGNVGGSIMGRVRYKDALWLDEGEHIISFKVGDAGTSAENGAPYLYMDYFELVPQNVEGANAKISGLPQRLKVGSEISVKAEMYFDNGIKYPKYNSEMPNFSSSNEWIAEIDSEGNLKTFNPGKTVISAEYNINGISAYAECELTVYDECGIIPVSAVFENGAAMVELTNLSSVSSNALVMIAGYGMSGEIPASLEEAYFENVTVLPMGITRIEKALNSEKADVYIWNNLNEKNPYSMKYGIK